MKIKKQLVKSRAKTFAGTNPRRFITIHETANTSKGANAQAHANLQSRGFSASWHYTVDDTQAIQSFPHTVRCWHAGDGRGHGNMSSIGIEICVNSDGDYDKAVANAAELVRKIMAEENIPLANVVQHNHWSGKNCPTNLRKGGKWREFISQIAQTSAPAKPVAPKPAKPASPSKPAKLKVDGLWGAGTTRRAQEVFGTYVDGVVSSQPSIWQKPNPGLTTGWDWKKNAAGSPLIRAIQKWLGVKADGKFGEQSIRKFQARMGTPIDGKLWRNSPAIKEFQRRLNEGKI